MAYVRLYDDMVQLRLRWWEKVAGRLRDIDVPIAHVQHVACVTDGRRQFTDMRPSALPLPLPLPGAAKVGTWRRPGRTVLVAVRAGAPALTLELLSAGADAAIVTFDAAASVADQIRAARIQHDRTTSCCGALPGDFVTAPGDGAARGRAEPPGSRPDAG